MAGCGCEVEVSSRQQSRVLIVLLLINATMFVAEFGAGWLSDSTALIADSLDMLADAVVYGIALYAVGRTALHKAKAAHISGVFQLLLGLGVAVDVTRRAVFGSEPESLFMIVVGFAALVANVICVVLISRHRHGDVHMRASWIFSTNDVLANLGVIIGGLLVLWSGSHWPDLFIGLLISLLVMRGGILIIRQAREEKLAYNSSCNN